MSERVLHCLALPHTSAWLEQAIPVNILSRLVLHQRVPVWELKQQPFHR
jgi:hypothetical protein